MKIIKRATINDVAKEAGVSKRTVSRVINKAPNVSQKTRTKIQAVIDELGFVPDKQAQGLAANKSFLLGMIYDNPDALYIDQVQRGMLKECAKFNYELVVHPCEQNDESLFENVLHFIERSNIDGVVILPPLSESKELAQMLRESAIPYVRLASIDLDDHANIVISDEHAAVTDMTRYLLSLGHRNIAMITGPQQYHSSLERMRGFTEVLSESELPDIHHRLIEGTNKYESGIECARRLLIQSPRPTAIFANNDEMAAGVLKVAYEMGIKVPQELSICGFDDNLFASRMIPTLTTIQRPVSQMAGIAAKKIISLINDRPFDPEENYLVTPHLIIRESTHSINS